MYEMALKSLQEDERMLPLIQFEKKEDGEVARDMIRMSMKQLDYKYQNVLD